MNGMNEEFHLSSCNNQRSTFPGPVRTIAVTGGKGGIGKTNISVNLAIAMAELGNSVVILDADFGLANVDVLLNLKNIQKNIQHVVKQSVSLEDILIEGPKGVKIIPASSGVQSMTLLSQAEYMGVVNSFDTLNTNIDTLIIDTAAGISDDVIFFSKASQEILVVVCNEPTAITDAYAFIKVMNRDHNIQKFQIIANMISNFHEANELFFKLNKATERFLNVSLHFNGGIPLDNLLKKAVQQQRSVVDAYPNSRSAIAFKQLGRKVNNWPITHNISNIRFFIDRLIAHNYLQDVAV